MAVGLKDVAQEAGVSIKTVSDIVNAGRGARYNPETRERVTEAARALRYRPQQMGRSMRSHATGVLAFVAASFSAEDGSLPHTYVYPFLVGMSHRLVAQGYHVALVELAEIERNAEQSLPVSLQERFYDGLLIHWGLSPHFQALMPRLDIPAVWWDAGVFEPFNCIYRDESEVGRVVTKQLIERGHRRIGFMVGERSWQHYRAGQPVHFSYAQRYESYGAEMRRHALQPVPVVGYDPAALAEQLRAERLTAVITQGAANIHADPIGMAADKLGWRIPQHLSVAACDFEPRLPQRVNKLGGVPYDRYAIGQRAAQMLLQRVTEKAKNLPTVTFAGEFTPGDTIGPAPTA